MSMFDPRLQVGAGVLSELACMAEPADLSLTLAYQLVSGPRWLLSEVDKSRRYEWKSPF